MSRTLRFAFAAALLCGAALLPAGPAAAIDVCGNGICNTTTIPPENATNCPDDCGGGPPPACQSDFCSPTSCAWPAGSTADSDGDAVPDRLEFDLAHLFFPSAMMQWASLDRDESYFFRGWASPYTLKPFVSPVSSLCDEPFECLEVRWGVTFRYDHGDQPGGFLSHEGDAEMYAALLRRTQPWSAAKNDNTYWRLIRDFTSAHWEQGIAESSRVGAYGDCPQACGSMANDPAACNARSTCRAGGTCIGHSACAGVTNATTCQSFGCTWNASCTPRFSWGCYSAVPYAAATTIFVAESKHALYHTDGECDGGGVLNSDECPTNSHDLRSLKNGKLQNVGNFGSPGSYDTLIRDPDGCHLYDVWSGADFDGSSFRHYFTKALNWALDVDPLPPPPPPPGGGSGGGSGDPGGDPDCEPMAGLAAGGGDCSPPTDDDPIE